eukprot:3097-Heterococcus_DN1.PRE.3
MGTLALYDSSVRFSAGVDADGESCSNRLRCTKRMKQPCALCRPSPQAAVQADGSCFHRSSRTNKSTSSGSSSSRKCSSRSGDTNSSSVCLSEQPLKAVGAAAKQAV